MSDDRETKEHLLEQIADVQEHFIDLMNQRLPEADRRELELYLGILGKLVERLEHRDKSLRASAQELFGEVMTLVMTELTR